MDRFGIWNFRTPLSFFASLIWNTAEIFRLDLGKCAPTIFGWMIGCKKQRSKEANDAE